MKELIDAFDNRPLVLVKDRNFLINPLTDHTPTTTYPLLQDTILSLAQLTDYSKADKLMGEEDRGGFLVALMAYHFKMPFGMVKWNPTGYEGQQSIKFRNAYTEGTLYLNGVQKGDKVILVEDMIDSGGTIVAMVNMLKAASIELVDLVIIAEKEEYRGAERIKRETGVEPKLLLKFSSSGKTSKVTWVNEKIK
jgi:adenine phosphoribosyltransferase